MKKRLDQLLVDLGYAPSRTKAKELIERGAVLVTDLESGARIKELKASSQFLKDKIQINLNQADELLKYVSRAGLKLEGAIKDLNLNIKNKTCLDVGQSTGGFTDCLLALGAKQVTGIEVGKDQLHEKLKTDKRVESYENLNIRDARNIAALKAQKFDFIVVDVSFISLRLVLPEVYPFLNQGGELLALVKPQFELSASALNKKGIVKDKGDYLVIKNSLMDLCKNLNLKVEAYIESALPGRDGNQEFFIYAKN